MNAHTLKQTICKKSDNQDWIEISEKQFRNDVSKLGSGWLSSTALEMLKEDGDYDTPNASYIMCLI